MTQLLVKRLSPNATLPKRQSEFAAGYDLSSSQNYILPAGCRIVVNTDIAVAIPQGHYGRIAPRSGLAVKYGINVGAGVIDSDYRGAIGVVLFNHGEVHFTINKGDRIAQLIIEKISTPEVKEVENLDDTVRGSNSFGSTN